MSIQVVPREVAEFASDHRAVSILSVLVHTVVVQFVPTKGRLGVCNPSGACWLKKIDIAKVLKGGSVVVHDTKRKTDGLAG